MNINMVCLFGALGCLAALAILAVIATLSKAEDVPLFVYGVGFALVVAALFLFVAAGDPAVGAAVNHR